jgi:RNA polymerase sigma factor (sigma-70 family)
MSGISRDFSSVVRAASANDQRAWDQIVRTFTPLVRGIARRHRLGSADQDEVLQRTWIALVRSIGRLQDPNSIGAWLATTARRESLRVLGESTRLVLVDELPERASTEADDVVAGLIEDERRATLRAVADEMPARQRALVEALTSETEKSYEQLSAELDMPLGSIGPTRQRCVARMRRDPRIQGLLDEYAIAGRPPRPTRPIRPLPEAA